jgi:hypothetical protein
MGRHLLTEDRGFTVDFTLLERRLLGVRK